MSAAPVTEPLKVASSFLSAPYDKWPAQKLLAYFQDRTSVNYFAVADENEVVRSKIDAILDNCFEFNAERYRFDGPINWLNNPSADIEWAIMLHKFYYATGLGLAYQDSSDERYAHKWMALTLDWINAVPVDHLSSDVCGRRVQNWIFAHYYFVTLCRSPSITSGFYRAFLQSIHEQVEFLCENLTPARNHRTLELYSIFLAAVVFPELKAAKDWLAFSTRELLANIQSDILPDGVHCELSSDYHHIVMRNFLAVKRLALLNDIALSAPFDQCLKKALDFSVYAHKPDGLIPSLSDGDTGSFLNLLVQGYEFYGDERYRYVASSGREGTAPIQRCQSFPSGGYCVQRSGWGESGEDYRDERYLIFDCGPIGAGNHGHLDLLSFEMAAFGQSLIVDPGRYTYDESGDINWRVRFRGTAYHNTVLVDGLNQTRYEFHKKKFKITGEHPEFKLKESATSPGLDFLHGVAVSKEYPVVHARKIIFIQGEYWLIGDFLKASEPHRYELLFHLSEIAQGLTTVETISHTHCVSSPQLLIAQAQENEVAVQLESGFISKTYGSKLAAPVVKFSCEADNHCFYTVVYPYKTIQPKIIIEITPANENNPVDSGRLIIHIERNGETIIDQVQLAHHADNHRTEHDLPCPAVTVERRINDKIAFVQHIGAPL